MSEKETSFNITLPTLILLMASLIGAALSVGSLVSAMGDVKNKVIIHDARIDAINEKLNKLIGTNEALQEEVKRLNTNIDRIK